MKITHCFTYIFKNKMKTIFTILILITNTFALRLSHSLWDIKHKEEARITDILWNYCDLKCLYLENYSKGTDFVVITFINKSPPHKQLADCYQKDGSHYKHWSKVINNSMFSDLCWDQKTIDLLERADYKIVNVEGEGIGTEIPPF